jgi:hypothetical protein
VPSQRLADCVVVRGTDPFGPRAVRPVRAIPTVFPKRINGTTVEKKER